MTDIFTDDASNYDSSFDFDGIKASSDEINVLQYAVKGTVVNGKGAIYGDSGELNAGILQIAGTSVTADASELNLLEGAQAGVSVGGKAVIYSNNGKLTGELLTAAQPNITQVGTLDGLTIAASQNIDVNFNVIDNLADPTDSSHAATKSYDSASQGLSVKLSSKAATTANLSATYDNGTDGVGATLTASATEALVIDGVTLSQGDRVIVKDQTIGFENGIYDLTTVGDGSTAWVLTRSTDSDDASKLPAAFSFVSSGTTYENIGFSMNTSGALTIGTTDLVFTQFSAAGQVTAGTGLAKSGTVMSIEASQPTITQVGTLSSLTVSGDIEGAQSIDVQGHDGSSAGLRLNGALVTADATEINVLDGIDVQTSELNILKGVLADKDEINLLNGSQAATIVNSKAVIYGSNGEIDVGQLKLNGTAVTATAGNINQISGLTASSFELNKLDGATVETSEINLLKDAQAGTIGDSNAVIYDSNGNVNMKKLIIDGTTVTASASDINNITGLTANVTELNVLDGIQASTTELNVLQNINVTTDELNLLSGIDTTMAIADINKLSGLSTTAAELSLLNTAQAGTVVNGKTVVYGSDGSIDTSILKIGGVEVTATAENINSIAGLSVSSADLNKLVGLNTTTAELELLNTSAAGTVTDGKAVIYGTGGEVNATKLQIGGVDITASPADINNLVGVTADKDEINFLDGATKGTAVAGKAVIYDDNSAVEATLLTAAQPNITSTGTLDSLTVTGATVLNGGLTDSNKFTVADTAGDTSIGGTLTVTGDVTSSGAILQNSSYAALANLPNATTNNGSFVKEDTSWRCLLRTWW